MAWDTHPQSAGGWLYLLQPSVVFKARINIASAVYPLTEIAFDGVTVGAYTDIEVGQTVIFGSTAGAYDIGWSYVRKAPTSSVLYVGRSSRGTRAGEITATDNAYITVLDTYEVWKRLQYIDDAGELFKDYDIPGNTDPPPLAHMGDLGGIGRIAFASGGVLSVTNDASGSTPVHVTATIDTINWEVQDGTIINLTATTVEATYPVGKRWIKGIVVDTEGSEQVRRYLIVALDPTTPATVRFNNLSIKRGQQGQTLTADLQERLDPADTLPGTVVMYLARETRGSTTTIVQRFAGWLDVESSFSQATREYTKKGTTITAVDVAGKLAQLKALPSVIANEASQNSWLEMVGLNPDRYLHRVLAFETTALALSDLTLSGSSAYPVMSFSSTGGEIYGVGDGLARAFGRRLTCDSNGRLFVKADPMRQDSGDRTSTVQRHIGESAWRSIKWTKRARPITGALKTQNVVISSGYASALVTPFPDVYSIAPGEATGQGAGESSVERGIVLSQTESNARAGHDYARAAALTPPYAIDLAHGVDADIEPAKMEWVTVTATQGNAGYRGDTLTTARGLPLEVMIAVNAETGVSTQSLTWERETVGQLGARDPLPTGTQGVLPPRQPPTQPPTAPRSPTGTLGRGLNNLGGIGTGNTLVLTGNYQTYARAGGPTWAAYALGVDGNITDAVQLALTPTRILITTDAGGSDDSIYTLDNPNGSRTLTARKSLKSGAIYRYVEAPINANYAVVVSYYGNAGADSGTWYTYTLDAGATWSTETNITAEYATATSNSGVALWVSSTVLGEAIIAAYKTTGAGDAAVAKFYALTSNYSSKAEITTPANYDPLDNIGFALTKSWANGEADVYFRRENITAATQAIYRLTSGSLTDVTPYSGANGFGQGSNRGLHVAYTDPNTVVVTGNGATAGYKTYYSRNKGGDWTDISPAYGLIGVEIAGNDPEVIYGWGDEKLAYYDGQAWDDRSGNLLTVAPGIGVMVRIFGV